MKARHKHVADKLHTNTYFSCVAIMNEFTTEDCNYFGYRDTSYVLLDFMDFCHGKINEDHETPSYIDPKLELKFLRAMSAIQEQFDINPDYI